MVDDPTPEKSKGDQDPAEDSEAPAKKKSPVLILAILSVVMIGAGWAVTAFVLAPMLGPQAQTQAAEAQTEEEAKGEIVSFANIIVNPSGTLGSRYLNTTVGFEVTDETTGGVVQQNEPRIKDALITQLSSRTIEELTDPAVREQMREAILKMVNEAIAPHKVRAVYFLDFVLQ